MEHHLTSQDTLRKVFFFFFAICFKTFINFKFGWQYIWKYNTIYYVKKYLLYLAIWSLSTLSIKYELNKPIQKPLYVQRFLILNISSFKFELKIKFLSIFSFNCLPRYNSFIVHWLVVAGTIFITYARMYPYKKISVQQGSSLWII